MEPSPNTQISEPVLSERPQCLVVDGHPIVRIGVRRALQDRFECQEASSREEAVDLIRDIGSIDVAILDMRRRPDGLDPAPLGATETIRMMLKSEPGLGIDWDWDAIARLRAAAPIAIA